MKSITVQGLNFDAPEPYSAGHVLLANEANQLNTVFAENLRNNFASAVKDAKSDHGDKLPADVIEDLRNQFESYAATYQFGAKRVGEVDPVRYIKSKKDTLTDEQKMAICESMGIEFKPKKSKAA